jgi:hypothetical protein
MSLVWVAVVIVFIIAMSMGRLAAPSCGTLAAQQSVSERWLAEQRANDRHRCES